MLTAREEAIRLLKLMMVASIVLPAVLFAFAAWVSYRNTERVSDERIYRSLDILHEHALKVFQTIERTFAEINEITRGMSDNDIRANETMLHDRFKHIVDELPQLEGIAIMGGDGHPLVSSNSLPVPKNFDFSDRDFFKAQVERAAGTYISGVEEPRMGGIGSYFFALSQRRVSPDGQFNGIISIAVLPNYFESFYARMGQSDGNYFGMARADGGFLARLPAPKDRMSKLDERAALRVGIAQGLDRDIYWVDAQLDGIERRIGYRKLTDFPVYVLAGVEQSTVVGEWARYMSSHLIFGLPATAFLFAGLMLALRRTQRLYDEADRREVAEGALRQAQRLEAIGQLTGGVAHDFNNLLMIVSGSVQRLRAGLADKKQVRLLDMIATATQRGESLTRQLLTYSRQQTLTPQVIDLSQRLPMLRELLTRSLRADIEIKVDVPNEVCAVRVDPGEFELAIINLAVNAKDAMPKQGTLSIRAKGVTLKGEATAEGLSGEFVAIRVADTGEGIPADVLPRVFEPFFTTKEVGKGTGLGLSQVYGFAHQAGGTVQADSTVGQGTTITIYLPASTEAQAVEIATANDEAAGERHPVVLVVDDSVEVAEVTSSLFEHLGYETVYRESADEALKLLAEGASVDLVFSDIVMPGTIDGVGLAHEVRSRYPGLPVMLTTGYSAAAAAAPSGLRILPKPFDSDTLRSFIQDTMDGGALAH